MASTRDDDPPPPRGTVLPKKHGDDPPGAPPEQRGSVWTWGGRRLVLDCDHRTFPELVTITRLLYAGQAAATGEPDRGASPVLRVEWATDGAPTGVTTLYRDGFLTVTRDGVERVEGRLSEPDRASVEAAISALDPTGLRCPDR